MIAVLGRRARLLAHAEHELRGALTALALEAPQLDLSRARAGLADLEAARTGRPPRGAREALRLDRVVWAAATRADLAARRAGGRVRVEWRAGAVTVAADRARVSQALENLLDNAIEHGGAQVTVTGRRTARGVRVVVRDEGAAATEGPRGALPAAAGGEDLRGHGLAIAAAAARRCGGSLARLPTERGIAVAIDMPVAR